MTNDYSAIGTDPYGYVNITTFDVNFDAVSGFGVQEKEEALHPHLEGYEDTRTQWFAVVEATPSGDFYWGPYATRNAAASVLAERGTGRVIHMNLI